MRDWKLVAQALGLDIPEADLDRVAGSVDKLDASFRPLLKKIPLDCEPAYITSLPPEDER